MMPQALHTQSDRDHDLLSPQDDSRRQQSCLLCSTDEETEVQRRRGSTRVVAWWVKVPTTKLGGLRPIPRTTLWKERTEACKSPDHHTQHGKCMHSPLSWSRCDSNNNNNKKQRCLQDKTQLGCDVWWGLEPGWSHGPEPPLTISVACPMELHEFPPVRLTRRSPQG